MLDENILDYYHFQEHVTETSQKLFEKGSAAAIKWRDQMTGIAWDQGSLVILDRPGEELKTLRSPAKRDAVKSLRQYIASRIDMTDYPTFMAKGYDCGSGPTESVCGRLTKRLKGSRHAVGQGECRSRNGPRKRLLCRPVEQILETTQNTSINPARN